MSHEFNPNDTNSMLATLIERVDHIRREQSEFRLEMRTTSTDHGTRIGALETEREVRKRQAVMALGVTSLIGWAINVAIGLFHRPSP